jgi:hypothetical protein
MNTLSCWFLTPEGWRTTPDRVAIHDAETWPARTLLAGLFEEDPVSHQGLWREIWRDRELNTAVEAALLRFGRTPDEALVAA